MRDAGSVSTVDRLQDLIRGTQLSEAEVMTRAFQVGLRQLWRERIPGRYLRGVITEEEAIAAVGIGWVKLAERQHKAMLDDLEWALGDWPRQQSPTPIPVGNPNCDGRRHPTKRCLRVCTSSTGTI